jgi:hypothetical protein
MVAAFISRSTNFWGTELARAAAPFDTTIGSVADFKWLLRLTSAAGTVHVPKKLEMWRYHGDQLSMRSDPSRAGSRRAAADAALQLICERNLISLSSNAFQRFSVSSSARTISRTKS